MYNKLANVTREVNKLTATYRAAKAQVESEIDALPMTDHQKTFLKTDFPRLRHLNAVLAENSAHGILLEEFEKEFRIEWKKLKKASVEQRDLFLNRKFEEGSKVQIMWAEKLREILDGVKQDEELERGEEDAGKGTKPESASDDLVDDFPDIRKLLREPIPFGFHKLAAELAEELEGSKETESGDDMK
jgi:hypothetical protein